MISLNQAHHFIGSLPPLQPRAVPLDQALGVTASTVILRDNGRFAAMAAANVLIEIPEGCAAISKGALAEAWFVRETDTPYE